MAVTKKYDGVNLDDTQSMDVGIEQVEDSLKLLLHALYCSFHA